MTITRAREAHESPHVVVVILVVVVVVHVAIVRVQVPRVIAIVLRTRPIVAARGDSNHNETPSGIPHIGDTLTRPNLVWRPLIMTHNRS